MIARICMHCGAAIRWSILTRRWVGTKNGSITCPGTRWPHAPRHT